MTNKSEGDGTLRMRRRFSKPDLGPPGGGGGVAGDPAVVVRLSMLLAGFASKFATVADGVPGPKPTLVVSVTGAGLTAVWYG
jgi:hypothetical protein